MMANEGYRLNKRVLEYRENMPARAAELWEVIRGRQLQSESFTRAKPRYGQIVDFYCDRLKLAVTFDENVAEALKDKDDLNVLLIASATTKWHARDMIDSAIRTISA